MFGLTGKAVLLALAVVSVVAIGGTVFIWHELSGPRRPRIATKLAMILTCQIAAVSLVAAWTNDSYGFYASWADLFGTGTPTNAVSMPGPSSARAKFRVDRDGIAQTYFHGADSKLAGEVLVWTPPAYHDPAYSTVRFPVLMLLHGVAGSPETLISHGGMPGDLQHLIDAHRSHPFILVMPVVNPGRINTDCSDLPRGHVATWIAKDVPDLIQRHFRTLPGPSAWGVMGMSTGGFCAAKLPLLYPQVFGAGAAISPDPLDGDPEIIPDPDQRRANAPTEIVRGTRAAPAIFLATSRQDPDSRPAEIAGFVHAAEGTRVQVTSEILDTGGHNWGTFRSEYPAAIGWLSRQLARPGPAPVTAPLTAPAATSPTTFPTPAAGRPPGANDRGMEPRPGRLGRNQRVP